MSRSKSPVTISEQPRKKATDLGLKPTLVNMNTNGTKLSAAQKGAYNQEYATGKSQGSNFRAEYALPTPNLPVAPDSPEKRAHDQMEEIPLSPQAYAAEQMETLDNQAFENNR